MSLHYYNFDDQVAAGSSTIALIKEEGGGAGISSELYVSGICTFLNHVSFATSISVGGTITYEDVTNIDSIGFITARSGVRIIDGGLTISGVTTGLSVSGVTTMGSHLKVSGITTTDSFKVTGISTFNSDVYMEGKLYDGDGDFGTAGQILSSDGTDLEWIAPSTTSVANASNVGTNLDATDATQYVVFLGATSGNNPCRVDSQLTYNPSDDELGVSNLTASGVSGFAGYTESVTALGAITGSNNLDVSAGSVFTCTIAGTNAVTFTVTNSVASKMCSGIVIVTWTGTGTRSITMTNGKWQGGAAPTWSATATTDIFSFFTPDNGTNVYVSTLGVGYA